MVLNALMEGDSCFREVSVRLEDKGIVTCKKIPGGIPVITAEFCGNGIRS